MSDHAFAFGIEDLHLQGPQADDHLMAGVFGSGLCFSKLASAL